MNYLYCYILLVFSNILVACVTGAWDHAVDRSIFQGVAVLMTYFWTYDRVKSK